MSARDLMAPHEVWACAETSDCRHVAELMVRHNIGAVPVLDANGHLAGIVTDRDICCRIVATGKSFETPIRDIMSSPVYTCAPDADLKEVEAIMRDHRIRRLPVVGPEGDLLGFISLGDLAVRSRGLWKEHHLAEVLKRVSVPV